MLHQKSEVTLDSHRSLRNHQQLFPQIEIQQFLKEDQRLGGGSRTSRVLLKVEEFEGMPMKQYYRGLKQIIKKQLSMYGT